jgi:hypothetical protein
MQPRTTDCYHIDDPVDSATVTGNAAQAARTCTNPASTAATTSATTWDSNHPCRSTLTR